MGFSLRRAVPSDASALIDCIDAAYAVYSTRGFELPRVSDGVIEDIRDNRVFVAIEEHQILGCVIVTISGETAHLQNIAVHPDEAGRGIGKALIKAATDAAYQEGHSEMWLATHKDMPDNIALYRHLGWRVTGQDGNKILMVLALATDSN